MHDQRAVLRLGVPTPERIHSCLRAKSGIPVTSAVHRLQVRHPQAAARTGPHRIGVERETGGLEGLDAPAPVEAHHSHTAAGVDHQRRAPQPALAPGPAAGVVVGDVAGAPLVAGGARQRQRGGFRDVGVAVDQPVEGLRTVPFPLQMPDDAALDQPVVAGAALQGALEHEGQRKAAGRVEAPAHRDRPFPVAGEQVHGAFQDRLRVPPRRQRCAAGASEG